MMDQRRLRAYDLMETCLKSTLMLIQLMRLDEEVATLEAASPVKVGAKGGKLPSRARVSAHKKRGRT